MSDLAGTLLLDRTALSRTLDPLAARGLVAIAPGRDAERAKCPLRMPANVPFTAPSRIGGGRRRRSRQARHGKARSPVATLREIETLHPDPGGR